jgi:hypothetical protein
VFVIDIMHCNKRGIVCAVAVRSKLAVDDGNTVFDDVLTALIEEGEKLGTLMILKDAQTWTCGL